MKKSKLISFCIIVLLFLPSIVYANSNNNIKNDVSASYRVEEISDNAENPTKDNKYKSKNSILLKIINIIMFIMIIFLFIGMIVGYILLMLACLED